MENENEVIIDGKKYEASGVPRKMCAGCVGSILGDAGHLCHQFPPCSGVQREDGRDVVFVEVANV
jgi:hypothetical protein